MHTLSMILQRMRYESRFTMQTLTWLLGFEAFGLLFITLIGAGAAGYAQVAFFAVFINWIFCLSLGVNTNNRVNIKYIFTLPYSLHRLILLQVAGSSFILIVPVVTTFIAYPYLDDRKFLEDMAYTKSPLLLSLSCSLAWVWFKIFSIYKQISMSRFKAPLQFWPTAVSLFNRSVQGFITLVVFCLYISLPFTLEIDQIAVPLLVLLVVATYFWVYYRIRHEHSGEWSNRREYTKFAIYLPCVLLLTVYMGKKTRDLIHLARERQAIRKKIIKKDLPESIQFSIDYLESKGYRCTKEDEF